MQTVPTQGATPLEPPNQRGTRRGWASPRFWAAALILASAAVGVRVLPRLGIFPQKAAVPLKRPLRQFDVRKLAPRYVRHPVNDTMRPMSEDAIESLGTEEYLQIYVLDTQKAPTDPTRVANLFVTYYTGQPDMVPHVPDECYLAGGYDILGSTMSDVHVAGSGAPHDEIPVRVMRFVAPQRRRVANAAPGEVVVMYFFDVNAGYAASRNGVRLWLSNPLARYAYYAKIEVSFTDDALVHTAGADASRAALAPLLEAVVPVLRSDHFDLDKFASPEAVQTGARNRERG